MRRKVLKRVCIAGKLRQFSVLIVLLLIPLWAWAEDYPLEVAGILVTSDNAGNVFEGDQLNDGKVSYDSGTNTLTLDGVVFEKNGSIVYTGATDLTIALNGASSLFDISYLSLDESGSTNAPQLLFTKASDAADCTLHLDSNGD